MPTARPKYEATYEINASLQISRARIPAAGQPRSGARARHHVRLPAEPLRARTGGLRSHRAHHEHARRRAVRGHRQQRHPDCPRGHRSGSVAGRGSADRRAAGAAAGRRQEPIVVSDLGRGTAASGSGFNPAARFPGHRRACRQAFRRLGTPPAARAACICRLTAPARKKSPSCGDAIRTTVCSRFCTAASDWSTWLCQRKAGGHGGDHRHAPPDIPSGPQASAVLGSWGALGLCKPRPAGCQARSV